MEPELSKLCTNCTSNWIREDNEDIFNKNWRNLKKRQVLISNGFTNETTIDYTHDSYGFRNPAGSKVTGSALMLGCSFTYGVGLHRHHVWPEKLAKALAVDYFNAGLPAAASDTMFRIARILLKEKPLMVFHLVPNANRWEMIKNNGRNTPELFNVWRFDQPEFKNMGEWHSNEYRNSLNQNKNNLAIAQICSCYDIPYYSITIEDMYVMIEQEFSGLEYYARDLEHFGEPWHDAVANCFIKRVKND